MAKQIDIDKLHEEPPEVVTKINDEIINRRIDALNVKTEVRSLIGKEKSDSAATIKSLAESSNEKLRALFINMPEVEHAGEKYTLKLKEKPTDDEKKSEPKKDKNDKKKDEGKSWEWTKPNSWPIWDKPIGKGIDKVAGVAAASIPVWFEGARNFILNIPLLGDALKGAATLGEPLAKALQLPLVQSKLIAGAGLLKDVPVLGTLAPVIAPYILPTALTGGGLYALGKISDKLHNLARKEDEKIKPAGLFKTMWRGLITPVTLPWLAVTKAPTLVKKGFDLTKKVSAPLFRHKIGTYGGAFLGYSVLAGLTGGMAIPWAIAGGLGGRYIQKRWFTGMAAAPKLEAASEH